MIKVSIVYRGKGLDSLRIKGHAQTAEYGHDLVCAGVSAVAIGALNALEESDSYDIEIEEGDLQVECKGLLSEHDMTVFETMIIQLKTLEEGYPKAIEIKEKKEQ